jgi:hypothetical protein
VLVPSIGGEKKSTSSNKSGFAPLVPRFTASHTCRMDVLTAVKRSHGSVQHRVRAGLAELGDFR